MKRTAFFGAAFVFFFVANMLMSITSCRAEDGKDYEKFLKKPGVYSTIINFLRHEESAEKAKPLSFDDTVILLSGDFVFSLVCLLLALLLLIGIKSLDIKNFFWFFFVVNISWFICMLLFRMCWDVLDFLVVRLRPDLGPAIVDSLSLIMIIVSGLVYIWILARTFHLNFLGALGVVFVSHLLYLLTIFLFFTFVNLEQNSLFSLFKQNIGARPVIDSYLSDIKKITSGNDILSFVRMRAYHI